jgi:hypothetical protein
VGGGVPVPAGISRCISNDQRRTLQLGHRRQQISPFSVGPFTLAQNHWHRRPAENLHRFGTTGGSVKVQFEVPGISEGQPDPSNGLTTSTSPPLSSMADEFSKAITKSPLFGKPALAPAAAWKLFPFRCGPCIHFVRGRRRKNRIPKGARIERTTAVTKRSR